MIDIHNHILPGVDDGSQSIDMSLEMANIASKTGVRSIITTPHCYQGMYDNYATRDLQHRWDELHYAIRQAGIPIHLYQGMEVMAREDIVELLDNGLVWTMNGTKYFLIEFQFGENPNWCNFILRKCIDAGYDPIVAHPARYFFVQRDPAIVYDWYQMGCAIQLNKETLLGINGQQAKNAAVSLMHHGLVSCVASDAHRTYWRNTDMSTLHDYLLENFGEEYTYMVLEDNPDRILRGKRLVGYDPIPYEREVDE